MTEMFAPRRRWDVVLVLLALLSAGPVSAEGLQERLEALAAAEGFAVSNSERLAEAPAKSTTVAPAGATLSQRIRALLGGYNYVLLYDGEGQITELRISGPAPTAAADTARRRNQTQRYRD